MSLPIYTLEQVSHHNQPNDAWVAINGNVYNVTSFLEHHPGGVRILVKNSGTDASSEFKKFHDPSILEKVGKKFMIGRLAGSDEEITSKDNSDEKFGDLVPYGDPLWYQDWNSPYYNESHKRFRRQVRQFVDTEIIPYAHEWNEKGEIPKEVYIKTAKYGLFNVLCKFPVQYLVYPYPAGLKFEEIDEFHELIATDELCRCGSGGVVWGLLGGMFIGLPPVLYFGSEEMKSRVIPECLSGEKIICLCITEPSAGSDVANIKTEAKLTADGRHYIVNGEKKWITNGYFADYFTVAVRTGEGGMGGISLLLLEISMPGISRRKILTSGQWCSGTAYISFHNVKVPVTNLIGQENQGFKCVMYNFNHERIGMAIQANRFSRVCLEEAFKYALKRKTFGKKLMEHAVIRHKLGHIIRQVESTHAWIESIVYQTKSMTKKQQDQLLGGAAGLLKAHAAIVFENSAREATQVFGGLAYTRGGVGEKIERLYRDVRAYIIPGGSEEILLDLGVRQSVKLALKNKANL